MTRPYRTSERLSSYAHALLTEKQKQTKKTKSELIEYAIEIAFSNDDSINDAINAIRAKRLKQLNQKRIKRNRQAKYLFKLTMSVGAMIADDSNNLKIAGNNLNQITRAINSNSKQYEPTDKKLKKTLASLINSWSKLYNSQTQADQKMYRGLNEIKKRSE